MRGLAKGTFKVVKSCKVALRNPTKLVGLTKGPRMHTVYVHIIGTYFIFKSKGEIDMRQMAVHEFRNTLKAAVEKVIQDHEPLRVTRRSEEAFIVISEADWQREQETLHVLQNQSLMRQIAESLETHRASQGYTPTSEELDEITGV